MRTLAERGSAGQAPSTTLALASTIAFLGMNGIRLTLSNDEAYELVMSVTTGAQEDVPTNRGSPPVLWAS